MTVRPADGLHTVEPDTGHQCQPLPDVQLVLGPEALASRSGGDEARRREFRLIGAPVQVEIAATARDH